MDTSLKDNPQQQIKKLSKELTKARIEIERLKNELKAVRKKHQQELAELELRIRERCTNEYTAKQPTKTAPAIRKQSKEYNVADDQTNYVEMMQEKSMEKPFCFIGGNTKWLARMQEYFPNCNFISNEKFDENLITNSRAVVINTKFINHACVSKAVGAASKHNIRTAYTSKMNLNSMAKDLRNL